MVGHNWGAQHAERWIWLHGVGFEDDPEAWIDVAIGRVRVAGRTTPWVANGALRIDGERHRLGGVGARGLRVAERPDALRAHAAGRRRARGRSACAGASRGARGLALRRSRRRRPAESTRSHQHDVSNCSIAALTLVVRRPGRPARTLRTAHGAAYELGMRERDHGVPIAPFGDG